MEIPVDKIIKAAREAREYAYAPYSQFKVGAAVLAGDGSVYTGCNVENISLGLTCCAERVAVFKAVSCGARNILAVAVFAGTENFCPPCGACLQVMAEFGQNFPVYLAFGGGEYVVKYLSELLPLGFGPDNWSGGEKCGSC